MNKSKIILDNIALVIICFCIVISSLLVGTPLTSNYGIISTIINGMALIYLIISLFLDRNKRYINNILVLIVLVFNISNLIPLIFKSYISLSATMDNILDMTGILSLVILIISNENKNKSKYIVNSIITSGVILCFISIDNLTTNVLGEFLGKLGNLQNYNPDSRQMANFGYPNSLAIYIALCFILSIGRVVEINSDANKSNNKLLSKIIYSSLLVSFISIIFLSYSRGTYVILAIACLIYLLIINGNKEKINTGLTIITTVLLSGIFIKIYGNFVNMEEYINIYFMLIILSLVNSLLQIGVGYVSNKFENINLKKIIIVMILILIVGIVIFFVLMEYTKPLILFSKGNKSYEYIQLIDYIKVEDRVKVDIEFDAKSELEDEDQYGIIIQEKNEYNDTLNEHSIVVTNYSGTKTVEFEKQENTKYIAISYVNYRITKSDGLTIYSVKVNGQDALLDYEFLPKEIVYKIKNISAETFSVTERFTFIKDGLKIALTNPIIGYGGNAWRYLEYSVQEYNYDAAEVHSYIVDIFIENGILGFLTVIGLYIYGIVIFIKQRKNNKINYLILGVLLVLIHSIYDFDMSFGIVQIAVFSVFALCVNNNKINLKNNKINMVSNIIIIIFLGIMLCFNILRTVSQIYYIKEYYINEIKESFIDESIIENVDITKTEEIYKIYPFNNNLLKYILLHETDNNKLKEYIDNVLENEEYYMQNEVIEIAYNAGYYENIIKELIYKNINSNKKDIENMMKCYNIISNFNENKEAYEEIKNEIKQMVIENIDKNEYRVDRGLKKIYLEILNSEGN